MTLSLDDLYASPDHYLHAFDGDDAVFVPMDRAAYHRSIFLDHRISARAAGAMRVPVAMLAAQRSKPLRTGWIFHIAHGGSTLLARALDKPGGNLVLREPLALRQLGVAPDTERLAIVLAMLGKRYAHDTLTIVKANVPVNFILPDIAAADAQANAIFLHMDLPDYLLAVLRSPDHRAWVRNVTAQLAPALGDPDGLSDAERAAALWRAQMRAFAGAMALMPHARSLESEALFTTPAAVLRAAADHLAVAMTDEQVRGIVGGALFSRHAKRPDVPFDNAMRIERRAALAHDMAAEIAAATAWVERAGGPVSLGRPLV